MQKITRKYVDICKPNGRGNKNHVQFHDKYVNHVENAKFYFVSDNFKSNGCY